MLSTIRHDNIKWVCLGQSFHVFFNTIMSICIIIIFIFLVDVFTLEIWLSCVKNNETMGTKQELVGGGSCPNITNFSSSFFIN
jgi:hypothetical protein